MSRCTGKERAWIRIGAALKWYEQAANRGQRDAELTLADLYESGSGQTVTRDYRRAAQWYERAAEHDDMNPQGHKTAERMRLVVATELDSDHLMEAQRLAVQQSRAQQ